MSLLDSVRDALRATCDVPECTEAEVEPLFIDGQIWFLCADHHVEVAVLLKRWGSA